MKAQIITTFGDPTVFELREIASPTLQPGHVLIKVCATSVNPIDCKIRAGLVPNIAPAFPAVLHGDVAGVIVETADDVQHFKVGDEVYGCAGGVLHAGGALAEYMLADAQLLAKKPNALSMPEAATLPLVGITAWEALFKKTKLTHEQKILIHGGAGGVGHIAIQLAKWCGATVYTTVRQQTDVAIVQSLGADVVININDETVDEYVTRLTQDEGFPFILDTVGGANLDKCLQAAAINGHVVTTAARASHDLTPMHNKSLSLHAVFMLLPLLKNQDRSSHSEILTKIAEIVDQGVLKPLIDPHTFTLETISDAHAFLESGQAKGKVLVTIGP